MMRRLTTFLVTIVLIGCNQTKTPSTQAVAVSEPTNALKESKVVIHKNFASKFVDARNVEVYLPKGYDENSTEKYRVLYMHDGQNVFNPETSYTGIDWGVDETLDSLLENGKIKKTIVVAAWNNGPKRFVEYMPKAPAEATATPEAKKGLKDNTGFDQLYSDDYLQFLVEELKPFIDKTYNVSTLVEDTSVMGSSMGGLISLYAICKYPKVFGAAGCVSTHWPVPVLGDAFIGTLAASLPDPETHKIYFDFGTEGLDAQYEPFQIKVDKIMADKGYTQEKNWITKKFEGAGHNEKSWKSRIHIPLEFLLN